MIGLVRIFLVLGEWDREADWGVYCVMSSPCGPNRLHPLLKGTRFERAVLVDAIVLVIIHWHWRIESDMAW